MTLLIGILMYFGSLIIPAAYLLSTRCRGSASRRVLAGVCLQIFWSLVVGVFVYFSWRAGYADYYWGWALLVPVNAAGLIYFMGVLIYARCAKQ